ncbi:MAG: hypothetical protein JXR70_19760 [Spirochaetales bacterium]|nr:hypothetical protein [Spirochaetales bacterium]
MKGKLAFLSILFLFPGFLLLAQEDPDLPVLVLPTIELEIEDLSVEHIEADLPDEAVLVPAEGEIFLPEDIDIEVPEPDLSPIVLDSALDLPEINGESAFGAEAVVGVGNVNALEGRLSFYKLGDTPRYRFDFEHNALDGFSFEEQGQGFSYREDVLSGEVKFQGEKMESEFSGSFSDLEQGLQAQGLYYSKINRFIQADLKITLMPFTSWLFYGQGVFNASSFSLTGGPLPDFTNLAYPVSELLFQPEIGAELLLDDWNLGLSLPYGFRFLPGSNGYDLHRFAPRFWVTYQSPGWVNLSASVGYFLNHRLDMLVPFEFSIGGSPVTDFSFRLWGGLENQPIDFNKLWKDESLSYAEIDLKDNKRWNGNLMAQFDFSRALRLAVTAGLAFNSSFYRLSEMQDSQTGLLNYQLFENTFDVKSDVALRMKLNDVVSVNLLTDLLFLFTEPLFVDANVSGEIIAADPKGFWSIESSLELSLNQFSIYNLPVWDLSASWRIADNVIITGSCEDILFPFLDVPRYSMEPFVAPGIRGVFSAQINF